MAGGGTPASAAKSWELPSYAVVLLQPLAMGVLLGQGWHVCNEVLARGSSTGLALCAVGLLLGLLLGVHICNKGPARIELRHSLFWLSCTLNGGLAAIAQIRLKLGQLQTQDDGLVINLFLSSALLGTSLPHMFLKIIGQPDAEVLMPCVLAILASEAAAGTRAAGVLQVFVSLFLLASGLRGILTAPSASKASSEGDGGGSSSSGTNSHTHGSAPRQGSTGAGAGSGAAAKDQPVPFFPATSVDSRRYSPHFLVTRYARSAARSQSSTPLITLVERLDGSGQQPRKGRDRPQGRERDDRGNQSKERASGGKGEGREARSRNAKERASEQQPTVTERAPAASSATAQLPADAEVEAEVEAETPVAALVEAEEEAKAEGGDEGDGAEALVTAQEGAAAAPAPECVQYAPLVDDDDSPPGPPPFRGKSWAEQDEEERRAAGPGGGFTQSLELQLTSCREAPKGMGPPEDDLDSEMVEEMVFSRARRRTPQAQSMPGGFAESTSLREEPTMGYGTSLSADAVEFVPGFFGASTAPAVQSASEDLGGACWSAQPAEGMAGMAEDGTPGAYGHHAAAIGPAGDEGMCWSGAAAEEGYVASYDFHMDHGSYYDHPMTEGAEDIHGGGAHSEEWHWNGYGYAMHGGSEHMGMEGSAISHEPLMPTGRELQAEAAEFVPSSLAEGQAGVTHSAVGLPEESIAPLVDPAAPEPGSGRASAVRGGKGGTPSSAGAGGRQRRDGRLSSSQHNHYEESSWNGGGAWHDKSGGGKGKSKYDGAGRGRRRDDSSGNGSTLWAYIDPQEQVRVGFTSEAMREWLDAGYFDKDLLIALSPGKKPPPRSEFYRLRDWFPTPSKAFTYVPKF